jgi:hypothetical protein
VLSRGRGLPLAVSEISGRGVGGRRLDAVLALRIAFTVAATAVCLWLLATGKPLGGLVIVPALAVWLRHAAESGRLTRFAGRFARPS